VNDEGPAFFLKLICMIIFTTLPASETVLMW